MIHHHQCPSTHPFVLLITSTPPNRQLKYDNFHQPPSFSPSHHYYYHKGRVKNWHIERVFYKMVIKSHLTLFFFIAANRHNWLCVLFIHILYPITSCSVLSCSPSLPLFWQIRHTNSCPIISSIKGLCTGSRYCVSKKDNRQQLQGVADRL